MTARRRSWLVGAIVLLLTTAIPGAAAETPRVTYERAISGFTRPVQVVPGGREGEMFVVEQGGRIERLVLRGKRWRRTGTFLDISDRSSPVVKGYELGLLGAVFHPDYRRNGRFYVAYTRGFDADGEGDGESVVAEFRRRKPKRADAGSERILLVVEQPTRRHPVAGLAFDRAGRLYIGSGDGGPLGDPNGHAQDLGLLLGKILRIDPRDPDGDGPRTYRIPRSNPYVGRPGRDEIWASGLRNPWRFAFDPKNGDLWIGDAGSESREEVDLARAPGPGRSPARGWDFGWNHCEGTIEYADDEGDADDRCEQGRLPIFDYAHDDGRCAIIGGHILRGPRTRGWAGLYIVPDFCGSIFVLDRRGRLLHAERQPIRIVSYGHDGAGRVYAVERGDGVIHRVRFRGPRPRA